MTRIVRMDLRHVALPLRKAIRHASHERATSDSLVVSVTLDDGSMGFGEGVPRAYVTGETIESAWDLVARLDLPAAIPGASDYPSILPAIRDLTFPTILDDPRGIRGNAARAAVELACLDAYGRAFGASVGEAIRFGVGPGDGLKPTPSWVRYSGAVTAESRRQEWLSSVKMHLNRFHQVKLKVGVAGQDDRRRLATLRLLVGPRVDIRLDANESWRPDEAVEHLARLAPGRPSLIEQPVPHRDRDALAELRPRLGCPVMLDESLCGLADAHHAIDHGLADFFNLRISKCGGLFPTIRLWALARAKRIGLQLGCHPGESGLLSAAGRHLAANLDGFRYVEGSYDRHILAGNLIREDLTFGFRGWAKPIAGPGLGVTVDPEALEELTVRHEVIRYG